MLTELMIHTVQNHLRVVFFDKSKCHLLWMQAEHVAIRVTLILFAAGLFWRMNVTEIEDEI